MYDATVNRIDGAARFQLIYSTTETGREPQVIEADAIVVLMRVGQSQFGSDAG
ncbi:hypothetical protein ACOJBM_40285 [Rhizobium beringeri]